MGASRIGWALGVIAPWCLAAGLVASFSADAGVDPSNGGSSVARVAAPGLAPPDLVPRLVPGALGTRRLLPRIDLASLVVGRTEELRATPDEIEPRRAMKHNAQALPVPDRSRKGDPFVPLRPTFDARLRTQGLESYRAGGLLAGDSFLAFDGFARDDGAVPGPDSVARFEKGGGLVEGTDTSTGATAGASPGQASSVPTLRSGGATPKAFDGATPSVPRAVALGSTTPAPADALPVEVVVAPFLTPQVAAIVPKLPEMSIVPRSDRPDYAALLDGDTRGRELRCLAEAVYFEARSEPEDGQAAVAQVVLNRARSGLYPSSICAVVFQNRQRHNACQFSFACDGHALRINEPEAWAVASRIASEVATGETYVADVGGATHYHANYVRPRWARALKRMDTIGHHIFYQLRPGQT